MEKTDHNLETPKEMSSGSKGSPEDRSLVNEESTGEKVEQEISQEISSSEKEVSYAKIVSQLKSDDNASSSNQVIMEGAKEVFLKTDADSQIQHLVDVAMIKGVMHAIKIAKHIEDNYVLDTFHDRLLSEELNKALVEKGLISED